MAPPTSIKARISDTVIRGNLTHAWPADELLVYDRMAPRRLHRNWFQISLGWFNKWLHQI